jgi:hypothetical protein
MILYKQKPRKMLIGGLVSAASGISDWISGYDETDALTQTGATVIDPMGTAIDVLGNEDASTSDKVIASVNALMPGIGSFAVGQDTAERNQEAIDAEAVKKKKEDQDKMSKKSAENYAMQYETIRAPEGSAVAPTTQPTVTTWYNQQR